jgi:hypothetical protein
MENCREYSGAQTVFVRYMDFRIFNPGDWIFFAALYFSHVFPPTGNKLIFIEEILTHMRVLFLFTGL